MPPLDPIANEYDSAAFLTIHDEMDGSPTTVYDLKASDPQVSGDLIRCAADMITPEMDAASPLICGLIRSAAAFATSAIAVWSSAAGSRFDDQHESYDEFISRRRDELVRALAPATELMQCAVESVKAAGIYSVFRRALVEGGDRAFVLFRHLNFEGAVGLASVDSGGLKIEDRTAPHIAALRDVTTVFAGALEDDAWTITLHLEAGSCWPAQFTEQVAADTPARAVALALRRGRHVDDKTPSGDMTTASFLSQLTAVSFQRGFDGSGESFMIDRLSDRETFTSLCDEILALRDWRKAAAAAMSFYDLETQSTPANLAFGP